MVKNYFGFFFFLLTSIYYIISAYPFLKIFKKDFNIKEIYFYKILAIYTSSFLNYFYSDFENYTSMIISSKIGVFFYLFLLCIYTIIQLKTDFSDAILNFLMIGTSSYSFYYYFKYILAEETIFGYYFMSVNLISFFCIIIKNFEFEEANSSYIPFYNENKIIHFLASFLCLFYGFFYQDFYFKLSFGIQPFSEIILIFVYKFYKRGTKCYNFQNENIKNLDKKGNKGNAIEFEDEKEKQKINENI